MTVEELDLVKTYPSVNATVFVMSQSGEYSAFLLPNILRPVLFRRRFNLEWKDEYASATPDRKLNRDMLIRDYVAKYPGLNDADIANKIKEHVRLNDLEWGVSLGLFPRSTMRSQSGPTTPRRVATQDAQDRFYMEVTAQETEYGHAQYTATRNYSAEMLVPEDVLEEAARHNDPQIILDWVDEACVSNYDDCPETEDYEYESEECTESDNFEYTNRSSMERQAQQFIDAYRENHPELFEDEEDE